ncbi:MAG: DNA-3-methyladenine glycosylase 2 family protein [Ferruginibacter sp.]
MSVIQTFDESNFNAICNVLAEKDPDISLILDTYGYPPFWSRAASFETLVHIILEQQVSLASARAALNKLQDKIGYISANNLAALSNEELKACYFSRQKIVYVKDLAQAVLKNELNLQTLVLLDNDLARLNLTQIKGIGNWSADVYLMMVLHRSDLFPIGDIALLTSVKETKKLPKETSRDEITSIANEWKPYRTIAAFILWHSYLCRRKK